MPGDNLLKFGILKCRDLCTLYFGATMVAVAKDTQFLPSTLLTSPVQILQQDLRRIAYEIVLTNTGTTADDMSIGTYDACLAFTAWDISLGATANFLIRRSFDTDLDSVVQPLWAFGDAGKIAVLVREVFLTPAPVDEVQLG